MMPTSSFNQASVGNSAWLLKYAKGGRLFDKSVLLLLKFIYLGSRVLLRIVLGKKRRDRLYVERGINFKDFLYRSIEFLSLDNYVLLEFGVPKYDYKFYSLITRKVENFLIHDVHTSMSAHEDDIIERFTPKEGDVVIDIGAAFGFYTIISSKRVGANGKVVAIEALRDSFKMLNRNIKLNQLTNVIPLNYAVYSKETKVKLYHNYSIMPERAGGYTNKYVEASANTLDYFLQLKGITDVNWIKIDVEGAEFEVLKGATNVLSKSKDIALLIEIHNLSGGTNLYRPILEFLRLYNFKIEFEKSHDGGEKHIILRKQL
jgi:FkbM family methyltransferase